MKSSVVLDDRMIELGVCLGGCQGPVCESIDPLQEVSSTEPEMCLHAQWAEQLKFHENNCYISEWCKMNAVTNGNGGQGNTPDVEHHAGEQHGDLDLSVQVAGVKEATRQLREERLLRERNVSVDRASLEQTLSKLDSSMKKNAGLVRKLKQLHEGNVTQLLNEMDKVNQTKYVSEAVSSLLEAPLKTKDMEASVQVCCALHQRYEDFSGIMFHELQQHIFDQNISTSRKRAFVRLFFQLVRYGVLCRVEKFVLKLIRSLVSVRVQPGNQETLDTISILTTVLRSGSSQFFMMETNGWNANIIGEDGERDGGVAREEYETALKNYQEELGRQWKCTFEYKKSLSDLVGSFYGDTIKALMKAFDAILDYEEESERILNTRGDISEARVEVLEEKKKEFEALKKALETLADIVGKSLPEFENKKQSHEKESSKIEILGVAGEGCIFDDAEERALYENFPVLSEVVPPVLFGVRNESIQSLSTLATVEDDDENDTFSDMSEDDAAEDDTEGTGSVTQVLSRLPECVSTELCDTFSMDFVYSGGAKTKAQKQLAIALRKPPHGALQLLPFYSRIIATLSQEFPLIKETMVKFLQREFYGLKKKRDIGTETLDPRIRNITYISELIKFGVYPPGKAFLKLRSLLEDFSRHNIDVSCCMIQQCGRYLARRHDTAVRMHNMMQLMAKMKHAKNMEERQILLIEAATAAVYGKKKVATRKKRPPIREYIRYLIYSQLSKSKLQYVLQKILALDWDEQADYVFKILFGAVRKGKRTQIPSLACLVRYISEYYPSFGIMAVDHVMEEIYAGLETNDPIYYQRRISMMLFFSELQQERVVPPALIYDTVMLLLSHPTAGEDVLHESYFRIKLLTTLFKSSRKLLNRPRETRKFQEEYLPYFVEFVMSIEPLPFEVQLDIEDSFEKLGIKAPFYDSYEDACQAIRRLQEKKAARELEKLSLQSIIEDEAMEDVADEEIHSVSDSSTNSDVYIDHAESDAVNSEGEEGERSDATRSEDSDDDYGDTRRLAERAELEDEFDREINLAFGLSQGTVAHVISPAEVNASSRSRNKKYQEDEETMPLRVMVRKGGRTEKTKSIEIPVAISTANKIREKKEEEAAERAAVKRMVLATEF